MSMQCIQRQILRFPREANDELSEKRESLVGQAIVLLQRPAEVRVELGRLFIELKKTLKHGQWADYFERTFTRVYDITIRTARNYMTEAVGAERAKTESVSDLFPEAEDAGAKKIQEATKQARRKTFAFPLPLTEEQEAHARQLLKHSKCLAWAQRKLVAALAACLAEHEDAHASAVA